MRHFRLSLLAVALAAAGCQPSVGADNGTDDDGITWLGYREGWSEARRTGKPILIDFYATWCAPCKQLEERTLSDPKVIATASDRYVAIRIDVDRSEKLARRFQIVALPTLVLLSTEGKELHRISGYRGPRELRSWLERHADAG